MDTFWTLLLGVSPVVGLTDNENILYNKSNLLDARVAELADAQDLKSIIKPSTFFLSLLFLDGKAEIY